MLSRKLAQNTLPHNLTNNYAWRSPLLTIATGAVHKLAWHCAGTYNKADGSGGSNGGRMRFDPEASWGANAGLDIPRKALEAVKVHFYRWLSIVEYSVLFGSISDWFPDSISFSI